MAYDSKELIEYRVTLWQPTRQPQNDKAYTAKPGSFGRPCTYMYTHVQRLETEGGSIIHYDIYEKIQKYEHVHDGTPTQLISVIQMKHSLRFVQAVTTTAKTETAL